MTDQVRRPADPNRYRLLAQALRAMLLAAALVGLCWLAWGAGAGNEIDSHRLIVAECWNALDRKTAAGRDREEETQACRRMQRGFEQMYGAGA